MNLLFPLRYLRLENAYGKYVIRRDAISWLTITVVISVPFIYFDEANYFHEGGFLDKVGNFSAVLTGFYVAALIAVATLSSKFADLDIPITEGEVRAPSGPEGKGEKLSRRQYVCYMFGYMAFVSLVLCLFSLIVVTLSPIVDVGGVRLGRVGVQPDLIRAFAILMVSIPLSSLGLTTVRGLYYLIERLYAESPKIDNSKGPDESFDDRA